MRHVLIAVGSGVLSKSDLLLFPREIGLKRAHCADENRFRQYIKSLNGKSDIYTSLYSFSNLEDKDRTANLDRAWWDFDVNDRYGIEQVKLDVSVLISRLDGDIRLVATGRGFHIHQLFNESVSGVHWSRTLDRYQRKMAEGLDSLDGVGYPRKLTRVPLTYNPKRGRWAVMLPSRTWALNPITYPIPKKPAESMTTMHPFWGANRKGGFCIKDWAEHNPMELSGYSVKKVTKITGVEGVPMIPCLSNAITVSNPNHSVRVAMAQHLFEGLRNFAPPSALSDEQKVEMLDTVVAFIKTLEWTDFNERVTRKHLKTLMNYGRAPACSWYCQRGLCEAPCWRDDGTRPY